MGKSKTKYTKEFKQEAVNLVKKQGYTQAEAARNLGIEAKNLNRWIKEHNLQGEPLLGKPRLTAEQEELDRLRKEVKRLRMEREILKKVVVNSSYKRKFCLFINQSE